MSTCEEVRRATLRPEDFLEERGVRAQLVPLREENVEVYKIDCEDVREFLGEQMRLCDGLFLHRRRPTVRKTGIFVELKSSDIEEAFRQLLSTVQSRLFECLRTVMEVGPWRAVVVHRERLPRDTTRLMQSFRRENRWTPRLEPTPCDLRKLLREP